jgi:tetratricopeptide (TPR) repeat protein
MSDSLERVLRDLAGAPSAHDRWRDGAECPSEHALAALAEGRLADAPAAEVRAHLAVCGACVADARAALAELAEAAAEAGGTSAAAAGAASTRSAAGAPGAPAERRAEVASRGEPPRLRLVATKGAWIGLAAAALLLFLLRPFGPDAPSPRDAIELARFEPLPVRVPRGEADGAEAAFREGLGHYAEQRWDAAEAAFARAAELAPERVDVALYRGSTALLAGRPEEALAHLDPALSAAGTMGREARWQRAMALFALARPEEARAELEALAEGEPAQHRAADAVGVLEDLAALGW